MPGTAPRATYTRAADAAPVDRRVAPRSGPPRSPTTARRARGCTTASTDPLARDRIGWSEAAAHGHRRSHGRGRALRRARRPRHRASPPAGLEPRQRRRAPGSAATSRRSSAARRSPGEVARRDRAARQRVRPAHAGRGARGRPRRRARPAAIPARGVERPSTRAFAGRARHRRGSLRLRDGAHPARPPRRCGAAVRARARAARAGRLAPPTSAPAPWSGPARTSAGRTALARVLRLHPRDTTAASSALFLLGDLASDDRADARARGYYPPDRRPLSRAAASRRRPRSARR